ncbi:hypothetical protein [Actinophytocola glycyrrhizae]|uniref:DUF4041 domain-containing protein n=1 Tax=Actinophytocola glycyrrhizae TaxID=2044873 RepID=A0ABV9S5X3_9PSEU
MSDSWSDDRVSQLLDRLKTLDELRGNADAARGEAEARIAKIKSETRVKDRHLWLLLWANGDRAVYDEYRSMRDEVKHRRQQIARLPHSRQMVLGELDRVIADDLEQNDPDYLGIVIEQRKVRQKKEVCHHALNVVLRTREKITSVSASLRVRPNGKAAVAAARREPGEISAQLKVVQEKVKEVNRIVGSRDLVNGGLVKRLNMTFLGTEFGHDERKKQLDDTVRTLNEVARKVEASGDKFEKRLRELEKDRRQRVKAKRDRLLSMHGLTVT